MIHGTDKVRNILDSGVTGRRYSSSITYNFRLSFQTLIPAESQQPALFTCTHSFVHLSLPLFFHPLFHSQAGVPVYMHTHVYTVTFSHTHCLCLLRIRMSRACPLTFSVPLSVFPPLMWLLHYSPFFCFFLFFPPS